MPIKGLSNLGRLPRLGKIHLGVKVPVEGKEGVFRPKAVDYFVCPPEVRAVYGPKPRELRIMFLSNNPDAVASLYYRAYGKATGLLCKGDGELARALVDVEAWERAQGEVRLGIWATHLSRATERVEIPCAGEGYDGQPPCPLYAGRGCRRLLMLQFAVLGLQTLGVYQLDTSSFFGILNVNGFLELLSSTIGRIAGLPLLLRLVPQEVAPDGRRKTVHVLQLTADVSIERFLEIAAKPLREAIAAIQAPALEGPADAEAELAELPELDEDAIGEFFGESAELPLEEEEEDVVQAETGAAGADASAPSKAGHRATSVVSASPAQAGRQKVCEHLTLAEVNRHWVLAKAQAEANGKEFSVCTCCGGPCKSDAQLCRMCRE